MNENKEGQLREDADDIGMDFMRVLPENATWDLSPVEVFVRLQDELAEARSALSNTQSRWIPMGERLPTPGIYVLVTMQERPNFVSTSALVARGEGGCAWSNGADWTHWMPLPEAPK